MHSFGGYIGHLCCAKLYNLSAFLPSKTPIVDTERRGDDLYFSKKSTPTIAEVLNGLREKDLNLRPPGYEPDELPSCSIPRYFIVSSLSTCLLYHDERCLSIGKLKKLQSLLYVNIYEADFS